MNRRNWLELSRKLVDRYDMDFTMDSIESSIDSYSKDYYGAGVAQTPFFPNGLTVSLAGGSMGGTVTAGVAFDPQGRRLNPTVSLPYVIPAADVQNRKDLLVLRYKQVEDTLIPKPSDPITTTYLNLLDSYELVVIKGTPSGSPVYPTPLADDVILAGILVPNTATVGTDCTLDLTVRMHAIPIASRELVQDDFPITVDGTTSVSLSQVPCTPTSVVVQVGGTFLAKANWSISGQVVTFDSGWEPVAGQDVSVIYLIAQQGTVSPVISGGGGSVSTPAYHQLSAPEVTAKSITLSFTPVDPSAVVLDVVGGSAQVYGVDYSISGNVLTWAGLGLDDGSLAAGDYLRLLFFTS